MIFLIMGLPGSGKTTLANQLGFCLGAVVWNADAVRAICDEPNFDLSARLRQARRMRFLCDTVANARHHVIADFVCPTELTRSAFRANEAFVVWVDRIKESRYDDTNALFEPPQRYDYRYTAKSTVDDVLAEMQRRAA